MPGPEVYDAIGLGYTLGRRSDPRWMAAIGDAIGAAGSVVNVGAGAGSYEPSGAAVVAVEPSVVMLAQRPATAAPAARARAEHLPLADGAVEIAMAVLTVHHWADWRAGLQEMQRVAPRQVVVAYDTRRVAEFWLVGEYIPEIAELEAGRPSAGDIAAALGTRSVTPLPVPWDMTDGVLPAHWRRPAGYLDPAVRRNCSGLVQVDRAAVTRGVERLRADLETGRWHECHRELLDAEEYDAGFRLIAAGW